MYTALFTVKHEKKTEIRTRFEVLNFDVKNTLFISQFQLLSLFCEIEFGNVSKRALLDSITQLLSLNQFAHTLITYTETPNSSFQLMIISGF